MYILLQAIISNNVVRLMVSTTLATVTRLSQLVYDKKTGNFKNKKRQVWVRQLLTCFET